MAINIIKNKAPLLIAAFMAALFIVLSALVGVQTAEAVNKTGGDLEYVVSSEVSDEWRIKNDPEYRKYLNNYKGMARASFGGVSTPNIPSKLKNVKNYKIIDVSEHQAWNTKIDWKALKEEGITGAIIRAGYRGYGSSGTLVKDQYVDENISGALKAGIQVGVYFYTQAITTAEAQKEADLVLSVIKNYDITLPVFYDIEHVDYDIGRLDAANLSKTEQTKLCTAFCERIQSKNYVAGVYASKYYFYDELDYKTLESKYEIWLAHYTSNTDYSGDIDIWQYSSEGRLDGIYGYVDLDLWFGTPPEAIPSATAKLSGTSTVLSWTRPKGAFGFSVKKYNNSTGTYETLAHIKSCTYTVKDTNKNDRFQILPFKRMDGVYFSGESYNLSAGNSTKPVIEVQKKTVSETAVRVDFKADNATSYTMTLADNSSFKNSKTVSGGASLKIDSLRPNTTYYIKAYATIKSGSTTSNTDEISFTLKTNDLAKPTVNYASSNSDSNAIRIELNKVSAATGYRIWLSDNAGFDGAVMLEGGSSLRFNNLKPNTNYYLKAYSYMPVDGEKYFSDPTEFRYMTFDAKDIPVPTVNYAKSGSSTSAVRLEFDKIEGINYRVRICYDSSFADSKSRILEGGPSLRFDNLAHPNHTYYIRAQAYKTVNSKRYCSPCVVFTYKTVGNPQKPTVNYAQSGSSTSAVRIEFNKISGVNYRMKICYDSSFADSKSRVIEGGSSLRFDNLARPNYTYYVRAVTYKTENGKRYYSAATEFTYKTVGNPAKPTVNFAKSNSTTSAVRIEFNKVDGVGYRMKICSDASFADSKSRVVEGGSSLRFDNLARPNYTYYVRAVTYKTANGKRYYSAATEFTYKTVGNPAKPVVNFAKSGSSTSAVRIEFNKVDGVVYRMKICSDSSFADSKSRVVEGGSSLRFDNLARPNYTYYVRAVTYKTENGKRYYSAATEFTYKTVGNPSKPTVNFAKSNSTTSAVRIEFNKITGVNYRMKICSDASFADSKSRVIEGGSSLRFDNLARPNYTYYVRAVTYKTENGKRYYSAATEFTYKTKA